MDRPVWASVREDVGFRPVTEGRIDADGPLYLERWVYQARTVDVSGIGCTVLVTQLGGAMVREGEARRWRMTSLPSQSMLIPRGTPTSWHYSGPVDDVAVYLLDPSSGMQHELDRLATAHGAPLQFSDPVVAAAAQQLADELHSGAGTDSGYLSRLAGVMLEQAYRVLTAANAPAVHTRHAHFARLQRVLHHIDAHLAESLPARSMASLAGVGESHFRRIFTDATGMPPHRYVLARRSYFQFGYWSERPAQSLQTLAEARLAQAGRFRDVVTSTSGVRGDLLLTLRLDEIYLDTASTPQRVSLAVTAELIDWGQRRLIARRTFRQFAAVAQGGAAEFADAASDALGRMLGELVDWTVQSSR